MNAVTAPRRLRPALLAVAFGLIAGITCFHTSAVRAKEPEPSRVQVAWAPSDQLTEIKDNPFQRGWLRPADWQKSLGDYLSKRADKALAPGERLEVTFNDIKLAGDFEPWLGPNAQDIRIYKDVYPPRADLHYKLVGQDGSIVREGDSKLRDLSYLQRSLPMQNDPLRFDKRMLDDWIGKELVRKAS